MADSQYNLRLICYDISDPRRLGRLYRYLCNQATPVQYSVFLAELTAKQLRQIVEDVSDIIDECEDDVRIYSLPPKTHFSRIGQPLFADGIILSLTSQCELFSVATIS